MNNKKRVASLDVHSPLYIRTEKSSFSGGDVSDLFDLINKAAEAGFSLIQFNPIQDTGHNCCPYLGLSIFSFNPIHLSLRDLPKNDRINDLIELQKKRERRRSSNLVDYRGLYKLKRDILEELFKSYNVRDKISFDVQRDVLAYAVFLALYKRFKKPWTAWPERYREADLIGIVEENPDLHDDIKLELFSQEILNKQWCEVIEYGRSKGVDFILDKPIFPIHNSSEVWANQNLFYLKKDGSLKYASGCNNPKDPFGPQYWGNAVYKFKEKPNETANYIIKSIRFINQLSRVIRLDNAISLIWKYYVIDPKTRRGNHLPGLRDNFFKKLKDEFPKIYFIAEDAGFVSKRLIDDRLNRYIIPGLRMPQWYQHRKYNQIEKYPFMSLAATSTHDSESLLAWWRNTTRLGRKIYLGKFDHRIRSVDDAVCSMIKLIFESPAQIASITLRDVVGDSRRFNLPGSDNNQNWRTRLLLPITEVDFSEISKIIHDSGRD